MPAVAESVAEEVGVVVLVPPLIVILGGFELLTSSIAAISKRLLLVLPLFRRLIFPFSA